MPLDLKQAAARAEAMALVAAADALIEGNRPGVMERLGLGPADCAARNPRLVYGRMTGWGQSGPLAQAAGHDMNYVALTGLAVGHRGERPIVPPTVVGDAAGALGLVFGIASRCTTPNQWARPCRRRRHRRRLGEADVDRTERRAGGEHDRPEPARPRRAVLRRLRVRRWRFIAVGALEPQFYAELIDKLGLADVDPAAQYTRRPGRR